MQINHQHHFSDIIWHVLISCLFRVGATTCLKRANYSGRKKELVISVTMSDSAPLIPWQHKEFYPMEPMTNKDLDVHCFPTECSRGREIRDRTHSDQERSASFIWEMKFDSESGFCPYWELIWGPLLWVISGWKRKDCIKVKKSGFTEGCQYCISFQ